MLSYSVNGKTFELPLGDLYQEDFEKYFNKGVISFDGITDKEELYKNLNSLFGWVCRSLCMYEDDALSPNLREEKEEIRRKINQIDRMQRFFHEQGKVDKSMELISDFTLVMLEHYQKMMHDSVSEEKTNLF